MEESRQILAAIRQGDEAAFKALFYQYYQALYRQAYRYVTDVQVAEDIVQDTFVNLWKQRKELELHSSLTGYLSTSIRHLSLNYLKSRYARQRATSLELREGEITESPAVENIVPEELRNLLQRALEQLPEKCRIIFSLSRDHGLTYREIADELGISKETVKTQIKIALQKLRHFLWEHGGGCLLFFLF